MNRLELLPQRINLKLLGLLLSLGLLVASCVPIVKCKSETVAPLKAELPLVTVIDDPRNDYILDHPLFEENFDVVYRSNAVIPSALDIVAVRVTREGNNYCFYVQTDGENLPELLREGRHSARFGIYVDKDFNGASDVLLTTTDQPEYGIVITPDFKVIERMPRLTIKDNSVTMCVSRNIVGDYFDWLAISGYSPVEKAYHPTPVDHVFFVPEVDVAYPNPNRLVEILTSYSGTGYPATGSCQVIQTQFNSCPAAGNPPLVSVPGTSYQGVMIYQKQCGNLGYGLWCISQSFFGKRVVKGSAQGWVARCPFTCGYNEQSEWDQNQDGIPDKILHSVTDQDCTGHHDQDGDGKKDIMEHDYSFLSNQVTSCNLERNYQSGNLLDKRCLPTKSPYADPANVPGSIP